MRLIYNFIIITMEKKIGRLNAKSEKFDTIKYTKKREKYNFSTKNEKKRGKITKTRSL